MTRSFHLAPSRASFPCRRQLALAAVTALVLVAGCGGGTIGGNKQGEVRLVNAAGGAGPLDLYAGDSRIAAGVADAAASGYTSIDAGSPMLAVRLASSGASLTSPTGTVEKDKRYTAPPEV